MFDSLVMLTGHRPRDPDFVRTRARQDVYLLILRRLLEIGAVRQCAVVYNGTAADHFEAQGVQVHMVPRFERVPLQCLAADAVLVRGDKTVYLPALRRGQWKRWLFYAAEETVLPVRTWGYDVVLVDEPQHIARLKARAEPAVLAPFVKTADPQIFHPLPGITREYDVCVIGSMRNPKKNVHRLPEIVRALPNLRYLIIGRQEERLERELSGLARSLTCAGWVTREQVNELVNRSRVVLAMGDLDCSPRVLLEVMATGTPQVVNAKMVSGPAYIRPGAGLVAPLEQFPQAIRKILDRPQAFAPLQVFEQSFSPLRAAEALAQALRFAAEGPRRRSRLGRWLHNTSVASAIRRRRSRPQDPAYSPHPA